MFTRVVQGKRPRRWPLTFIALGAISLALFGSALAAMAAPPKPAVDIDQCRNGGIATPQTFTQCSDAAGSWVNGNAGASNSHYREGESITYRDRVTNLQPGQVVPLIISYDVIHSGHDAIDYLTSNDRWQTPETTAAATPDKPTATAPVGATLVNIPPPETNINVNPANQFTGTGANACQNGTTGVPQPLTSFNALPAAERQMEFYGVSGTPVITYVGTDPVLTEKTGDQIQQVQRSSQPTPRP